MDCSEVRCQDSENSDEVGETEDLRSREYEQSLTISTGDSEKCVIQSMGDIATVGF